jgi:hypothetical protein
MNSATPNSSCKQHFSHWDFVPTQLPRCPVRDCADRLTRTPFVWKKETVWLPYCSTHGLRLHGVGGSAPTYVYDNGPNPKDHVTARLRNFVVEPDYVRTHVLDNPYKAETHRLAYELSEDAVTWNVFVGLLKAGALGRAVSWLAGREVKGNAELYLWACRVDLEGGTREPFKPLVAARLQLEHDIVRYHTEPDVMLIVPGELVMFVEAKFGSGNAVAAAKAAAAKPGEKPKDVAGLVGRYYHQNRLWKCGSRYILPEKIGERFHSQLFRNVVFAAGIAELQGCDWHVVNLTRRPRSAGRVSKTVDYGDPTDDVRCYLTDACKPCFTVRTWEELYAIIVKPAAELTGTAKYMEGKSAHFKPAFRI